VRAAAADESEQSGGKGKLTPPAAGGTSAVAVSKPEEARPARPALPAAGGTSAAAADESKRSSGKGQLTPPAAGGTSAVAVSKPEQVGRPARPALPAAGETSTAAGAARQSSGVSGSRSGYRIPRLIRLIRAGYFENFQALPGMLDDCIIRAPETIKDKFFFSVLMEVGMVLSGRAARDYGGAHFRLQRKPERQSLSE
jgi:hypothetical protein